MSTESLKANREYKDSLFKFLFEKDKKNALSLYNAMNHSNYTNTEDLEFRSLENAFFIKMRNDVAFVFDNTCNLYEHQSSYNPNMPLRGLFYFADLYRGLIENDRLYSSRKVKVPAPRFVVFYNGNDKKVNDVEKMKLSELFDKEAEGFEWTATVININKGHSKEYVDACDALSGYVSFVSMVRKYRIEDSLEDAILQTIDECIDKGILRDFLLSYRKEVSNMVWTEFDEELYRKVCKQEDFEDGFEEGFEDGFEEGYNTKELEDKVLLDEKDNLIEKLKNEIENLKMAINVY